MKRFINSVGYALNGLKLFFAKEKNGQIQIIIGIMVLIASIILKLSVNEWIVILFCLALIPTLEMINSALEKICDFIEPHQNEKIKVIKDIAAAAVLWSTLFVILIGAIIFIPKILDYIK